MTKTEIKKLAKECIFAAVSGAGYKVWDNHKDYPLTREELDYFTEQISKYELRVWKELE